MLYRRHLITNKTEKSTQPQKKVPLAPCIIPPTKQKKQHQKPKTATLAISRKPETYPRDSAASRICGSMYNVACGVRYKVARVATLHKA